SRLYELSLLPISAEAVLLKPAYRPLFSAHERAAARARLPHFGYRPDWDSADWTPTAGAGERRRTPPARVPAARPPPRGLPRLPRVPARGAAAARSAQDLDRAGGCRTGRPSSGGGGAAVAILPVRVRLGCRGAQCAAVGPAAPGSGDALPRSRHPGAG